MDESIRPRTADDPQVCEWCGCPIDSITGKCSGCGRVPGQTDTPSECPQFQLGEMACAT